MNVTSEQTNETFPMAVVYPTNHPSKVVRFGPFEMALSVGAVVAKGKFHLVIISHGSGGSNLAYRSIAFALVERGFIVGMPLHPKNNYQDNSDEGSVRNWEQRPKHIKAAISRLLSSPTLSPT